MHTVFEGTNCNTRISGNFFITLFIKNLFKPFFITLGEFRILRKIPYSGMFSSIKESEKRIRVALKNNGVDLLSKKFEEIHSKLKSIFEAKDLELNEKLIE